VVVGWPGVSLAVERVPRQSHLPDQYPQSLPPRPSPPYGQRRNLSSYRPLRYPQSPRPESQRFRSSRRSGSQAFAVSGYWSLSPSTRRSAFCSTGNKARKAPRCPSWPPRLCPDGNTGRSRGAWGGSNDLRDEAMIDVN
jgi:hypothetical protein